MPLTPNDILQKRFRTTFRGLDADEVTAYLRTVAAELEDALRESAHAREAVIRLEDQIEEFRHMETTLRNTLISSQKVGQEIRTEAEHQADLVTREAHIEAQRLILKAETRLRDIEQEILRLMAQRRRFRAEFDALLQTHADLLQADGRDTQMVLEYTGDELHHPDQLSFEAAEGPEKAAATEEEPETSS